MRDSFKNIIDAYLMNRKSFPNFTAGIQRNSLIGFHPSGLHNACPRRIVYEFLGERKQLLDSILEDEVSPMVNNPKLERTFDTGHVIHMLIQYGYLRDYAKQTGLKYKVEVPVKKLYKDFLIGGTADVVLPLQSGKLYVVDIKTSRSELFYKLKDYSLSQQYLVQANFYMLGLGIPRYKIYYWNKNDGDTKEFHLDYDREVLLEPIKIVRKAKEYLKLKNIPEMQTACKSFGKEFSKCPFSGICIQQKKASDLLKITTTKEPKELIKPMRKS